MKKNVIIWGLMLFCAAIILADVDPKITIVAPVSGDMLMKHSTCTIRWTHSAYFTSPGQTCRILCGANLISPPVPVINDQFVWTVGRKEDGTILAQGSYQITIESPDYDALNGPTIHIMDSEPRITIVAPATGELLLISSTCTIRWTHSAYFDGYHQTCRVFCGDSIISPPVPVTDDRFVWTVGRKEDGTFLAPGNYPITIESPDYDALSGPNITLYSLRLNIDRYKFIVKRIPGCPRCFELDPRQIIIDLRGLDAVNIEIAQGRKVLARLGKFGRGIPVPKPVRITFDQENFNSFFELRVLSAQGKILYQQDVKLEIMK